MSQGSFLPPDADRTLGDRVSGLRSIRSYPTYGCRCAGAVNLLRRALGCRAEWGVVADLIAVAVGRDGPGVTSPACLFAVTGRRVTERLGPRSVSYTHLTLPTNREV